MKRNDKNLKEYRELCMTIWRERGSLCEECGKQVGTWDMDYGEHVPKWHNFAHQEGRRTRETCLDPNKIRILCFKCHSEIDHNLRVKNSEWLDR